MYVHCDDIFFSPLIYMYIALKHVYFFCNFAILPLVYVLYNWILFGYYHHLKDNFLYMSGRVSCFLVLKLSKYIQLLYTIIFSPI